MNCSFTCCSANSVNRNDTSYVRRCPVPSERPHSLSRWRRQRQPSCRKQTRRRGWPPSGWRCWPGAPWATLRLALASPAWPLPSLSAPAPGAGQAASSCWQQPAATVTALAGDVMHFSLAMHF